MGILGAVGVAVGGWSERTRMGPKPRNKPKTRAALSVYANWAQIEVRHVAALWRFCPTAPATRRAAWESCARPSERAPAHTLRNTAQTAEQAPSATITTMCMTYPRLMRGITVTRGAGDGQRG